MKISKRSDGKTVIDIDRGDMHKGVRGGRGSKSGNLGRNNPSQEQWDKWFPPKKRRVRK